MERSFSHCPQESSSPSSSSSSTFPGAAGRRQSSAVKAQSRDGVFKLCAMTSGVRHNWVQAVLENIKPAAKSDNSVSGYDRRGVGPGAPSVPSGGGAYETHDHAEDLEEREGDLTSCSSSHTSFPTSSYITQALTDPGHTLEVGEVTTNSSPRVVALENESSDEYSNMSKDSLTLEDSRKGTESLYGLQGTGNSVQEISSDCEDQGKIQREARDAAELLRRVELLAQQLLATGDVTAVLEAHLEEDSRYFQEQRAEWEGRVSSLKSQLSLSERRWKEAESRLEQLKQESQSNKNLRLESESLQRQLHEVTEELQASEDAQAEREARLQKHLLLLRASQERERRGMAGRMVQAEEYVKVLQARLEKAEEQVDSLSKSQILGRDIEEAQRQLQDELTQTISAVRKLQKEREDFTSRCHDLQGQLLEADREVSRLQERLRTEETDFYDLEHSYEQVYEELLLVLGQVQQREMDTQNMREGYERLLDGKEQELSEVLLKMEVLGTSLEDTETKLGEALRGCTCASSRTVDSPAPEGHAVRTKHSEDARIPSHSSDQSQQHSEDPEKLRCAIQLLQTKLNEAEEKLRDVTARTDEPSDPQLCSQLTQSRAKAQHLSLLLHSQAQQSRRFAQDMDRRSGVSVDRFRAALKIARTCVERLGDGQNLEMSRQFSAAVAILQQGEKNAEEQQRESRKASKEDRKVVNQGTYGGDQTSVGASQLEDGAQSVGRALLNELLVVEKMASVLQSRHSRLSAEAGRFDQDTSHTYQDVVSRRVSLETEGLRVQDGDAEPLEEAIERACIRSELVCAALRCQQQHRAQTRGGDGGEELPEEGLRTQLHLHHHPGLDEKSDAVFEDDESPVRKNQPGIETKEADWLEELIARLRQRAKFLRLLCCQEVKGSVREDGWSAGCVGDLNRIQEQVQLIYLSERFCLHVEDKLQQSKAKHEEEERTVKEERDTLKRTLSQLQEDTRALGEELDRAKLKLKSAEAENQQLRQDALPMEDRGEDSVGRMEREFQAKIGELQEIHEDEMRRLLGRYSKCSCVCKEKNTSAENSLLSSTAVETNNGRKEEQRNGSVERQPAMTIETQQASHEQELSAVEEKHRDLVKDLQRQHRLEVAALHEERNRLLQEETAATRIAIIAIKRFHREEQEKSRRCQTLIESGDVTHLHLEYEKEVRSLQRELEVLSVQHTQKCLENSQLSRQLQEERRALDRSQKENQELKPNAKTSGPAEESEVV